MHTDGEETHRSRCASPCSVGAWRRNSRHRGRVRRSEPSHRRRRSASRQATTHTWLVCTAAHTLSRSPSVTERTDAAGSWLELGLSLGATRRDSGTGDESGAAGSKTSMAPFRIRLTGAERRAQGKGDACQEVGLSRASATVCLCGVLARLSLCADPALSVSGWVSRVVRETAAGWPNVVRAVPLG